MLKYLPGLLFEPVHCPPLPMNLPPTSFEDSALPAWTEYVHHQRLLPEVDPLVANSWKRCWPRVNPFHTAPLATLNPGYMNSVFAASAELTTVARPIMEDIYEYIENSNSCLLLFNGAGYVLEMLGDAAMIGLAREFAIARGTLVTESQMGTNAFSIALIDGVPARVRGAEHFVRQFHSLADAAAPTYALSGRPLGALGLLCLAGDYHPHTLGLMKAGARAIESQRQSDILLFEQNIQLTEINLVLKTISEGLVAWNAEGVVVHANAAAAEILGLPDRALVGKPVSSTLGFPEFLWQAIHEKRALTDEEGTLRVGEREVNCILSVRFGQIGREAEWVILILRPISQVRQLVQRQVGAEVALSAQDLIGKSQNTRQVRSFIQSAAPARAAVLVRGESGTGKNMLARALHFESPRSQGPFIIYNCASVPAELFLVELLGYEEGGTGKAAGGRPSKFELANGGTLFFQNIEDLPLEAQATLLNVIDLGIVQRLGSTRPMVVDVRIIASSMAKLEERVAQGSFRADLYYRLSPFEITLAPLRERRMDIPLLSDHILQRLSRQHNRPLSLVAGLETMLKKYAWPGNISELEAVLERAVVQAGDSEIIGPMHFPDYIRSAGTGPLGEESQARLRTLETLESETIIQAARQCHGNLSQMAKVLGIGRTTVWRKLKELNISPDDFRIKGHKI